MTLKNEMQKKIAEADLRSVKILLEIFEKVKTGGLSFQNQLINFSIAEEKTEKALLKLLNFKIELHTME